MSRVPKSWIFSNSDEKTLLFWNYAYISSLSVKKVENKFSLTNLKKSVGFWHFLLLMIDHNFTFWKIPVRETSKFSCTRNSHNHVPGLWEFLFFTYIQIISPFFALSLTLFALRFKPRFSRWGSVSQMRLTAVRRLYGLY